MFLSFSLSDIHLTIWKLEDDLHNMARWCCENNLHVLINPNTTKLLFIGTRQLVSGLRSTPIVTFLGKPLRPDASVKHLGVILDPHLTYNEHVSKVVSSCDHVTPLIRQLNWFPVKQLLLFRNLVMAYKYLNGLAQRHLRRHFANAVIYTIASLASVIRFLNPFLQLLQANVLSPLE